MKEEDLGLHTKGGVITQKNTDYCTIRTRMPAGILTVDKMRGIADVAEQFGQDTVHLTTRQTLEIPHIHYTKLEEIGRALLKNGTPVGSERDEVVNVVACPGTDRCKFANIDSIGLAMRLDKKLFGQEMPVKMRISISACPYACTSPILNEIGIVGRVKPIRAPGVCTGCGQCADSCRENAIKVINGEAVVDDDKCFQCGICIEACPFNLVHVASRGYLITVGGRRGRHPQLGRELIEVETEDEVVDVVYKLSYWIYRRAWSGRLLSDQLDDIHFEKFKEEVLAGKKE